MNEAPDGAFQYFWASKYVNVVKKKRIDGI